MLVAGMQIGFLFLEAGFVRSKNSINVSMKNLADFVIAVLSFHILGAAIMFGGGFGAFGFDLGLMAYSGSGEIVLFLLFQALFCGTAATIVSGAIAERLKFSAYLILTIPLTMLIYPIIGHWAWAGLLPGGEGKGWLEALGFFDFAGSSVVHVTGGAAALAILTVVGSRRGRFVELGEKARAIHGHSPILAGGGALFLLVGWLGFNSGTLEPGTDAFARALANTLYAGSSGALAAAFCGFRKDGYWRADRAINGLLVGLVAITASAPFAWSIGAIVVGALAGGLSVIVADWMDERAKLDDAVYAVSVHGFGGVLGTLAVPFIVPSSELANGPIIQFAVQALGVVAIGGFTFITMRYAADFLHKRGALRVTIEDERRGLNITEHKAIMGNAKLLETLEEINAGKSDLSTRITMDPFDEGGEVAGSLNAFLGRVEASEKAASDRLKAEKQETALLAERERERANQSEAMLREFQLEFAALVEQLKGQARDLSEGSVALSNGSVQSGELVDEASEQAATAAKVAEHVSQGTENIAQTLILVGEKVERAHAAVADADKATEQGSKIASTLESSTREISKLVALIEDISDTTRVLALNAQIEAARAGEAGRGFAVVSSEVGDLARQTEAATKDISRIVDLVSELIGSSVTQFRAIGQSMETVRDMAGEAAKAVVAQRRTGNELRDMISEAKTRVLSSGEAVARVSENFAAAAPTIERIDTNSEELDALARRIDYEVMALRRRFTALSVQGFGAAKVE